jgi:hypothetical protein
MVGHSLTRKVSALSLFQTDAWLGAWWNTWGTTAGFSSVIPGGSGGSGLYLDNYRFRGVLPIRCLQFVGTNYRRISTPRTEYNQLRSEWFTDSEFEFVQSLPWNEAVFRDIVDHSPDLNEIKRLCKSKRWLFRVVHSDDAYGISALGDFHTYLGKLGYNTRLRLFNRRKVLQSCGEISRRNLWPNECDTFFQLLNDFHRDRWGTPCFGRLSLAFHKQFLADIEKEGGVPQLSLLSCDQSAISVLYNVEFKGTVYNLQSGYLESFHKKLSIGSLHLGYCIEEAFLDPGVRLFDLLAGGGKNDNYKKRLATDITPLVSVMIVRGTLLKLLYLLKHPDW